MITIIDNFFEPDVLNYVKNHITTRLHYVPRFHKGTTEKTKENYYGDRFILAGDPDLFNLFKETAENKFKYKLDVCITSGVDLRNLDSFRPHTDEFKFNILIMLKGPTAVTNGTVFYNKTGTNLELDTHVGFRENRAIMFPSDHYHSPHRSEVRGLRRYTATLFIKDYERLL